MVVREKGGRLQMMNVMKPWISEAYALMRIMTGLLFTSHGLSKLAHFPVPPPPEAPAIILYTAGPIELVCGALVALGWLTRPAAFLASGTMAVAYFVAHFPRGFLPIANGGELAVLYCFAFLFIAAYGSGIWSVDASRGQS
jgi:putative oxidoreductase